MIFLYDLGIQLYMLIIRIASLRNAKAKQWLNGQNHLLQKIAEQISTNQQCIWFHFASLGEFEQGRPVMEQVKRDNPEVKLVITFFSPSGYEIRKKNDLSPDTFYLPIDTKKAARQFIDLINPKIAVFTKYEYWYHYYKELHTRNIPIFVISANFRKGMSFFKWYGWINREMLKFVTHFFVQNETSKHQLELLNYYNVTVTGDTRFDRVTQNALHPTQLDIIEAFCGDDKVFIGGSTWPEEEILITQLAQQYPEWKFILAPHEISDEKIKGLEKLFGGKSIRYSEAVNLKAGDAKTEARNQSSETGNQNSNAYQYSRLNTQCQMLIIDNIGMLSSLYQYANIAYIGGAFGSGLHNVLEAAAFSVPVIFGPKYDRFPEAKELIDCGGGFSIQKINSLQKTMQALQDDTIRNASGEAAGNYVAGNTGATQVILNHITRAL